MGARAMIDLNKNQTFDPPIELEVSNDNENWELWNIDEINHESWINPFKSLSKDAAFKYARHPQPKTIDKTKAQIFDPPVEMLVSDYEDFKHVKKRKVFCIYPENEFPILSLNNAGKICFHLYAKEITDTAELVLKDMLSMFPTEDFLTEDFKALLQRARKALND
jgi:hypothetical protein